MSGKSRGVSGYTIFYGEGLSHDLWASDDLDAMVDALSIAKLNDIRTFRLCRTGYEQMVIREVANITDKVC